MDLLRRSYAPVLPVAWQLIDAEAARVLRTSLAARKLVDFQGPYGFTLGAVNTGGLDDLEDEPIDGVSAGLRKVRPLVELRAPIKLNLEELYAAARGADDPDLSAVVEAAKRVARAEDAAIFNGYPEAGIVGIIAASLHAPIATPDATHLPRCVAEATASLQAAGIPGPYALVVGTALHEQLDAAIEEGHPLGKRIERLLAGGGIVHAPAVAGAVVLSARGGDYQLVVGQDLSIGYARHGEREVELYLTESFTFRVLEPAAAVYLAPVAPFLSEKTCR